MPISSPAALRAAPQDVAGPPPARLAVLVLSMLSLAGWLVAVDEWRSPRRSNLNLAIALWLAETSLVASLFLGLVVYNASRPGS